MRRDALYSKSSRKPERPAPPPAAAGKPPAASWRDVYRRHEKAMLVAAAGVTQAALRPNPMFEASQDSGNHDMSVTKIGVEWPLDFRRRAARVSVARGSQDVASLEDERDGGCLDRCWFDVALLGDGSEEVGRQAEGFEGQGDS